MVVPRGLKSPPSPTTWLRGDDDTSVELTTINDDLYTTINARPLGQGGSHSVFAVTSRPVHTARRVQPGQMQCNIAEPQVNSGGRQLQPVWSQGCRAGRRCWAASGDPDDGQQSHWSVSAACPDRIPGAGSGRSEATQPGRRRLRGHGAPGGAGGDPVKIIALHKNGLS